MGHSSAFPVLRRPGRMQSAAMDMTIKNKIKKRQQRLDLGVVLEEHINVAHEEDAFDRLLGVENDGAFFGPEADQAWGEVKNRMRAAEERGLGLARRFENIIETEQKRKEEAIREYKRAKRQRLRRAKREKEAQRDSDS